KCISLSRLTEMWHQTPLSENEPIRLPTVDRERLRCLVPKGRLSPHYSQARKPDLLRRQHTDVPRLQQADDVSGIIDSNGLLDRVVQRRRQDGVQIGPLPVLPDDPHVDVCLVDGREYDLPVVVNVRRRETRPQRSELVGL